MRTEANASNLRGSGCRPHARHGAHRFIRPLGTALLEEADEREMAERRHGAALDQANPLRLFRPPCVTLERKLRTPAELARRRCEPVLERAPESRFGTDAANQDDLTARLEDPCELIKRCFRIGRR